MIVFGRTRHTYDPYRDFFRLAELSGYSVQYLDTIDWERGDQTVIGTPHNGEWDGIPQHKRSRLILWNLERPTPTTQYGPGGADVPPGVDEVWTSDQHVTALTGAKYVFLGGHRAFAQLRVLHKQYDFISLMAWFGRRTGLHDQLHGLINADVPGGTWGDERHARMNQSHAMISAHQDENTYLEPPRFMLAGCYALPLISEHVTNGGYWKAGEHYLDVPFTHIGCVLRSLLGDEVRMARLGASAWRLVCVEHPFKQEVERAL